MSFFATSRLPEQEENIHRPIHADFLQLWVCVLTYKRPERLAATLKSILAQTLRSDPAVDLRVLVVDNDALGSAQEITHALLASESLPFRYVVERQHGVVHGRNRVLDEAQEADFLALIDDDEVAADDWLERLLRAQRRYSADVVTGPVDPSFEAAPSWVIEGGFFAPRSFADGCRPRTVETNNVLLSRSIARRYRFDLRFNHTGGEDTFFFASILNDGARVVWCEHARVTESISPARADSEWLVDRERSNANRYTRTCISLHPGLATVGMRIIRAVGSLGIGIYLLISSSGATERKVRGRQQIARFLGTVSALRGRHHTYYKKDAVLT